MKSEGFRARVYDRRYQRRETRQRDGGMRRGGGNLRTGETSGGRSWREARRARARQRAGRVLTADRHRHSSPRWASAVLPFCACDRK